MSLTATISIMAGASLAAMAANKIAVESGYANIAQYITLFASCSVGGMALSAGIELVKLIAGI